MPLSPGILRCGQPPLERCRTNVANDVARIQKLPAKRLITNMRNQARSLMQNAAQLSKEHGSTRSTRTVRIMSSKLSHVGDVDTEWQILQPHGSAGTVCGEREVTLPKQCKIPCYHCVETFPGPARILLRPHIDEHWRDTGSGVWCGSACMLGFFQERNDPDTLQRALMSCQKQGLQTKVRAPIQHSMRHFGGPNVPQREGANLPEDPTQAALRAQHRERLFSALKNAGDCFPESQWDSVCAHVIDGDRPIEDYRSPKLPAELPEAVRREVCQISQDYHVAHLHNRVVHLVKQARYQPTYQVRMFEGRFLPSIIGFHAARKDVSDAHDDDDDDSANEAPPVAMVFQETAGNPHNMGIPKSARPLLPSRSSKPPLFDKFVQQVESGVAVDDVVLLDTPASSTQQPQPEVNLTTMRRTRVAKVVNTQSPLHDDEPFMPQLAAALTAAKILPGGSPGKPRKRPRPREELCNGKRVHPRPYQQLPRAKVVRHKAKPTKTPNTARAAIMALKAASRRARKRRRRV